MRPLAFLLFLGLTRSTLAEGVRIESLSFRVETPAEQGVPDAPARDQRRGGGPAALPHRGTIAFWTEGRPALVYVMTQVAEVPAGKTRLAATVRWLVRAGDDVRWSEPEARSETPLDLRRPAKELQHVFTIPMARRVREWKEAGFVPLRCEVTVSVGDASVARDLPVLP